MAKNTLDPYLQAEELPKEKKELEAIREACRRLWLVSKGMPHNKVLRRAKENPDLVLKSINGISISTLIKTSRKNSIL